MKKLTLTLLLLPLALAACGPGDRIAGMHIPDIDVPINPVVLNVPDFFSLEAIGVFSNRSFDYDWTCTDDQANIEAVFATGEAAVRIRILDAAGALVHDNTYSIALPGRVQAVTRPGGMPGTWHVHFEIYAIAWAGSLSIGADLGNMNDRIVSWGGLNLYGTQLFHVAWGAREGFFELRNGLNTGSLRVRMWDGAGTLRMDETAVAPFSALFQRVSSTGAAGVWTIQLDLAAFSWDGAIELKAN